MSDTLDVTGVTKLANNATVGGTLGVKGVTTLGDTLTVSNNATVAGTVQAETLKTNGTVSITGGAITGVGQLTVSNITLDTFTFGIDSPLAITMDSNGIVLPGGATLKKNLIIVSLMRI